ncbi:iron chelate uptake ABC transporter family permease subunit [candidate division GN15 bacterium]|nr:iron chelate uptake ABC transporter family permease subunit [candidate division GN15 bacterium]
MYVDYWDLTLRFFSMVDANVQTVALGSVLLGCCAGVLSTFVYLQKRSLIGDALAHSALPGVGIAFLIVGSKDLVALLVGAAIAAWLGALSINAIVQHTKLKLDSALGIVLSVFFGAGIVILTHIQKSGSGAQSGLDTFLFGQAAAISRDDVIILAWITAILLALVILGFNRFMLLSFDRGFAQGIGSRVGWLQFLMTTMVVLAVTVGLQAVGVVLMAAMLITPAAAARQWTDRIGLMIFLAAVFGMVSGLLGAYVSFLAPRLPTGPWIIVVISIIFAISILFAPRRGVVSRWRRHRQSRRKVAREHVLKALYKAGSQARDWSLPKTTTDISRMQAFAPGELTKALGALRRQDKIVKQHDGFLLTAEGLNEGARVLRRHRLWEVYLTEIMNLASDHVHRDAEEIEHVLTPEMEAKLEKILGRPAVDPHHQEIPWPENGVQTEGAGR